MPFVDLGNVVQGELYDRRLVMHCMASKRRGKISIGGRATTKALFGENVSGISRVKNPLHLSRFSSYGCRFKIWGFGFNVYHLAAGGVLYGSESGC